MRHDSSVVLVCERADCSAMHLSPCIPSPKFLRNGFTDLQISPHLMKLAFDMRWLSFGLSFLAALIALLPNNSFTLSYTVLSKGILAVGVVALLWRRELPERKAGMGRPAWCIPCDVRGTKRRDEFYN